MTVRYAKKIEDALGIGEDWLMYGKEDAKECPCGEAMIRFLKNHPKLRMEIWEEMQNEERDAEK